MKVIKLRLFLLLFLFPKCYLLAQYPSPTGPFNYSPIVENDPKISIDYNLLGHVGLPHQTGISFNLQGLADPNGNHDCLMIGAVFAINAQIDNHKPLVAFEYDTQRLLEIIYSDSTVIIKRYNHERMIDNEPSFYEYKLFDPLFISPKSNKGYVTWYVQIYFTSNFMLIVTNDDFIPQGYYMSPIYFGLDFKNMLSKGSSGFIDNGSYMYKFLKKDEKAKIIVGDIQPDVHSIYVADICVFSLSYASYPFDKTKKDSKDKRKNLWWHIQGNLSSPVNEPVN